MMYPDWPTYYEAEAEQVEIDAQMESIEQQEPAVTL